MSSPSGAPMTIPAPRLSRTVRLRMRLRPKPPPMPWPNSCTVPFWIVTPSCPAGLLTPVACRLQSRSPAWTPSIVWPFRSSVMSSAAITRPSGLLPSRPQLRRSACSVVSFLISSPQATPRACVWPVAAARNTATAAMAVAAVWLLMRAPPWSCAEDAPSRVFASHRGRPQDHGTPHLWLATVHAKIAFAVAIAPGLRLGHVPRLLLPAAGAAAAIAALLAAPRSATGLTAYGQASGIAAAADLAAGIGLVAAGLLAWIERSGGRLGAVAMLTGIAWFAPDWEGWEGGPPLVRSLGLAFAPFALALPLALVLAGGRVVRIAIVGLLAGAAVAAVGRALVHDPFLDPYCWRNCTDNVFLVRAEPGIARALDTA